MAREVLIPKEWEYTKQIQKIIKKNNKTIRKQQKQPQQLENIDSTEDSEGKKTRKNTLAAQCDFEGHTWKTC